jgi:hypothetical protein
MPPSTISGAKSPRTAGTGVETDRAPRICMLTARRFDRMAFRCAQIEAQDVLQVTDDVDLIHLEPKSHFRFAQQWQRRLMYRDVSRKLAYVNPGLRRVRLARDYDLLIVMCQTYWDFLYINAIDGWKERCRTSVIWMDELWAANLAAYRYWLPSIRRFDHIVVGLKGTVDALGDAIGRRCHYVPAGVDAIRFMASPDTPARVIDIYSMGRRREEIHRELVKLATRENLFYMYDTLQSGESLASDPQEHRTLYANTAKRSKFFMVAPGKVNVPEETKGQVEVGFRYYEGSAAGSVLLGQAPDCSHFREMFDWPDAVVSIREDGSDVVDVIRSLTADPERMLGISRQNGAGALLRHDWVYRWRRILEIAALQPTPAMLAREAKLKELAVRLRDDARWAS